MSVARGRPVQMDMGIWPSGGGLARDMMAAQVPGPPGRRHETAEQRETRLSARRPRRVLIFIARYGTRVRVRIHSTAYRYRSRRLAPHCAICNAMHSPSKEFALP